MRGWKSLTASHLHLPVGTGRDEWVLYGKKGSVPAFVARNPPTQPLRKCLSFTPYGSLHNSPLTHRPILGSVSLLLSLPTPHPTLEI